MSCNPENNALSCNSACRRRRDRHFIFERKEKENENQKCFSFGSNNALVVNLSYVQCEMKPTQLTSLRCCAAPANARPRVFRSRIWNVPIFFSVICFIDVWLSGCSIDIYLKVHVTSVNRCRIWIKIQLCFKFPNLSPTYPNRSLTSKEGFADQCRSQDQERWSTRTRNERPAEM